jgi:uncharacterized protein (TIGR02001 family)
MIRTALLIAACGLGIAATAPKATAFEIEGTGLTIGVTPAVATDYLFRGISQTRNRPSAQLTLDVAHESGLYIGAFAANVAFAGTNVRQEIDLLAGFRFTALDTSFDVGGVYYWYPGYDKPDSGFNLDYFEFALRASREFDPVKLLGAVFVSPDYQAESGTGVYVEGGIDIKLPYEFILGGRLGYQWIDRNPRFGTPDFLNFGVFLSRTLFTGGPTATAGYYGTDISQSECVGGQKICDNRFMFTLSWTF